jgi:hypothetical protein
MCPTTAENPPLVDPLDANHFNADCHTASLLDTDHCNAACLDAVLCDADHYSICHHNADPHTGSLHGADLCNAKSSELLLKGISSEGNNQVMETGTGGFKASKAGREEEPCGDGVCGCSMFCKAVE